MFCRRLAPTLMVGPTLPGAPEGLGQMVSAVRLTDLIGKGRRVGSPLRHRSRNEVRQTVTRVVVETISTNRGGNRRREVRRCLVGETT